LIRESLDERELRRSGRVKRTVVGRQQNDGFIDRDFTVKFGFLSVSQRLTRDLRFSELLSPDRLLANRDRQAARWDFSLKWAIIRLIASNELQPSFMNAPLSDVKSPPPTDNSEVTKTQLRSALDLVSDNVAVLDTNGNIVITNVAWREFALAYSPQPGQTTPHTDVGCNYLEVASRCITPQDESSQAVEGIRAVLSGNMDGFCMTYPCHTPAEQHWFTMTVTPLEWEGRRGALVKHADTTPRHHLDRRSVHRLIPNFPNELSSRHQPPADDIS
jgi:PAS domain-containing protein